MRFVIKNITGNLADPNPALWAGVKLYACSDNLSNLSIIGPGETQSISAKAYEELKKQFPLYFTLQDSTGAPDTWAAFRADINIPANTWLLWDAGRMSGKWDITNPNATKVQWSFSGFQAPDPGPEPQFVSEVDANETLQFWTPMNPLRYIYLFSATAVTIQILVS